MISRRPDTGVDVDDGVRGRAEAGRAAISDLGLEVRCAGDLAVADSDRSLPSPL